MARWALAFNYVASRNYPSLSPEGAAQCLSLLDEYLASTGLEKTSPGGRRGIEGVNLYDLVDTLEVQLSDGTCMPWGDLKQQLDGRGVWGNLKRENGEWGDSDGVHFYIAAGTGEACIHDFARDVTHWDRPGVERLAEELPEPPADGMFGPDPARHLVELLENYVLLGDKTVRHIDHPEHSYALDAFKALKSHWSMPSPATGKPIQCVTEWAKHPEALRADKAGLRPDHPDDVIVRDGKLDVFNTYNPPMHPDAGGEVDTMLEFASHLFPDDAERGLFLDWIALKVAHPGYRMHAMLTVTQTQGTGRGTWAQILQKLFGLEYVNSVELPDLIGAGSQAQFNEYLATSLIVYVPEALEEKEDRSKWQSRHIAYERLKLIVETTPTRMHVKRKYGRNSPEWVLRIAADLIEPSGRARHRTRRSPRHCAAEHGYEAHRRAGPACSDAYTPGTPRA